MNKVNDYLTGYKVIISGSVQGVGFRYFTAVEANKLGVSGHARNLSDGNVEVIMFGKQPLLHKLLTWLEKGPKTSSVRDIFVTEMVYIHKEGFICR